MQLQSRSGVSRWGGKGSEVMERGEELGRPVFFLKDSIGMNVNIGENVAGKSKPEGFAGAFLRSEGYRGATKG